MFSLKKMTVLCWDDESSISSLSLESQIFNFKDYFSSRIWNEDEFRSVFDEIDPSTGKCQGELLIGGAVIRVYGDFHVTKENRYYMESANVECLSNPVPLNKDGSTATSSNDDTEVQNQNGEHVSSNDSSSEYSNANSEDSNTHSEQENTDTDVDCSKNTVTYEDSRTQDVVLLLMNNLDVIKKVPDKNYEIHAKEDFYKDTEKKYPYIFRENNNYKILINEGMTLGCRSELGAKLLVALYNDRDAKKFIDSDLDNGYVDGIYQDLNNASEVKDANVDKSLQALHHMKLDLENTTSTMRTNV
ncbi:MAG: hypothetical protein ACLT0A_13150 [Holdemanella porci]|uniref:hypothetical protein n=1 Tax=Holdemanella TaxID=1573535 RepID=UPI002FDDABB0